MGISSGRQKNKPIYNTQIEGAGNALTGAYNTAAPKIQQVSDTLTGLIPDIASRFTQGDAGVNAARNYNVDVLGGRYLDQGNPYLEQMIAKSGDDVRNQSQAALGVRGLTGGSSYADIISKNLANSSLAMRYQDYGAERDRMGQAAALSPGLSAAEYIPIASLLGLSESANDPLQAAVGYSSGLGGLLGQYQDVKTKSPWGAALASALSNAASAYAMGG